jgi:hypothetical protein
MEAQDDSVFYRRFTFTQNNIDKNYIDRREKLITYKIEKHQFFCDFEFYKASFEMENYL